PARPPSCPTRRSSDLAAPVEGEPLVRVLTALGQIRRDDFRLGRRLDLSGSQLVADDLGRRRVIEIAVAPADSGRAAFAERFFRLDRKSTRLNSSHGSI